MGTTHVALTLANYLCSKLGIKTAYVELNTTNQIQSLTRKKGKPFFRYKNITFYPNTPVTRLPEILHQDYQYFVLDMGVLNTYNTTEFLRCNKSFLICSRSKWRRSQCEEKIAHLFQNYQTQNRFSLIMNLTEEESTTSIFQSRYEQLSFPYISNPFQLKPRYFRAFYQLLKNI